MRKLILLLFLLTGPALGLTCTNVASTDQPLLQAAMNVASTATINGPCKISGTLSANAAFTLIGGTTPTITQTAANGTLAVNFNANGFTMSGLTFVGGGWNANSTLSGITLTNNTIQFSGSGVVTNGMVGWKVVGNTITDIWPGGVFINYNPPNAPGPNPDTNGTACWADFQGLDSTLISSNIFRRCSNDGFHINPNGSIHSTNASEFSYNQCTQSNRACYEIQAFVSNFVIKGNYAAKYNMPNWNSFDYSIASVGRNLTFINNFGSQSISFCSGGVAEFLELFIADTRIQGNVLHAPAFNSSGSCTAGPGGIGQSFYTDWNLDGSPQGVSTLRNNVQCGNSVAPNIEHENSSSPFIVDQQFDFSSTSACSASTIDGSNVSAPAFVAGVQTIATAGTGTWNTTQLSDLPVINTSFFIDGSTTPVALQELQDVSTTFSTDHAWHYHATFSVASLGAGTHTLKATATDVLGATASTTQNFIVGSVTGPAVTLLPSSLIFGTFSVGTSSPTQTSTLSNVGTSSLTESIAITGPNAGDFSFTSTCTGTLAASATCPIVVTFTPTVTGPRMAFVTVTDNAPGSPHTVALTGGPAICAASIISNCDFKNGMTGWGFAGGSLATEVVDTSGPMGSPAAHISVSASVPLGSNIELTHDGVSYPANGTWMRIIVDAKSNRGQQINIRGILSVSPFTDYGLTYQPSLTNSWGTYTSAPFQVTGSPTAGSGRLALQVDNAIAGDEIMFTNVRLVPSTEVNNISFFSTSHGSTAVDFTTLTASTGIRIRYAVSPTDCSTGATGAGIFVLQYPQASYRASFNQLPLGGLHPATTYNVCPEASKDFVPGSNPGTWSTGAMASVTTLPLPAIHPAKPIKPLRFDTSVPANVGSYATHTTLPDCSDFGTLYVNAVALQATNGTVISYPAGTCPTLVSGQGYQFAAETPDIHHWATTDVDTVKNTIAWTAHGFTEGELVLLGRSYAGGNPNHVPPIPDLVIYPSVASCPAGFGTTFLGGMQSGPLYPVHVVDADHISLFCVDGVTPMDFTDSGTVATGQTFYAVPFRKFLNTTDNEMQWARRLPNGSATPWIIARSVATDTQLTPEHVQITAAHESLMTKLVVPAGNAASGTGNFAKGTIYFGSNDPNVEIPTGNIRIGPGIEITTEDYAGPQHTSDPWMFQQVLVTYPWNSGIVFDRIWYKLLENNRANVDRTLNGSNIALVDSKFSAMEYWHAANVGLVVTKTDSTHLAVTSGRSFTGTTFDPIVLAANETITIAGSGSGRVRAYWDLMNGGALTVSVPSGIAATCAPTTCVSVAAIAGTPAGICNPTFNNSDLVNYTENASDLWPKTANGEPTVGQIGCGDVTAGSFTTAGSANPGDSLWNPEGDSTASGLGPGPLMMKDNDSEGAGITWFIDDSGEGNTRGNYTYLRNNFVTPRKYLLNSPESNGKSYFHRQHVEFKAGVGIEMAGNHNDGGWVEDNNNSPFIAMTVTPGNASSGAPPMSDIDIHDNIFEHGGAMLEGPLVYCTGAQLPCSPAIQRVSVRNNVAYDINGYVYAANNINTSSANNTAANGWLGAMVAVEDFVFDHNTILPTIGRLPWLWSIDHIPDEGFTVTNNVLWYTLSPGVANVMAPGNPAFFCTGLATKGFMDCAFTSGPGNPSYTFANNLIGGGYADSSVPSGQATGAASAFAPLVNNYFTSGGTVPATIAALQWLNPDWTVPGFDLHLLDASPIKAGNNAPDHSADVGADINHLYAALGRLTVQGVQNGATATTATVAYTPADSGVCVIDISATDPNAVLSNTRFTDSGGSRSRSFTMTGLVTKTFYYGMVRCSGNARESQKPFSFKTN
jgi:hypothetical protein